MLSFFKAVFGTEAGSTTSTIPHCWRIQNIPLEWSQQELLEHIKKLDESLEILEPHWLSVYPAYSGNVQTGLLNMEISLKFFEDLNPDKAHPIMIVQCNEESERIEIDLSFDYHFHGLTPLNVPVGENIIDVVAVTGLSGHAFESWRNRANHRMWLKDFLSKDIPENIRILTYGYNSSLIQPGRRGLLEYRRTFIQNLSNARSTLAEKSRPLIFIGHSLGCILITQTLIQSRDNPDDRHILDATCAAFFFGAPHAGLKIDALVAMVEDLTSSNRGSTRLRLLEQLEEDSEFLEAQREGLSEIWAKMKIFSFYELKDTPTVKKGASGNWERGGEAVQMVKNISAMLFLQQEKRFAVNEDHTNMVKFMIQTDPTYKTVVLHLRECRDQYIAFHSLKKVEDMRKRKKELNDFLQTLEAFSCQPFRDDLLDKRHKQTCLWFFDCDEYKDFVEERSSPDLLWISGDPGSGKSVLMSYVTKQLANHRTEKVTLVAYFFCDDKRHEQNTAIAILRSLIYQILDHAPSLYQYIPREYLPDSKFRWGFGSLWQVFERLVINNDSWEIFCVIDALDECEEETREQFLENLRRLFERSSDDGTETVNNKNIRLIITSRPELPSTRELPILTQIPLEDRNKQDIQQYVDDHVRRIAQRKKLPSSLEHDMQQALVSGAGGMFLWVSLTLYRIRTSTGTSANSIRAQLKELPKDIPAIYARILEEIDVALRRQAKRILEWVNSSKRPLSVEELKTVIALQLQPQHTSVAVMHDHIENNLEHFFGSLFGPLLKIERDTVRFVHQSVKDFLGNLELMKKFDSREGGIPVLAANHGSEWCPVSAFHSPRDEAHLHLAIDCLIFLSSEEFEKKQSQDALEYHSRLKDYPFLEYAATKWPEHLKETDTKSDKQLLEAFRKLAQSNDKMNSAYQIYHENSEYGEYGKSALNRELQFKSTPPLQICASLGFTEFVKVLMDDGADINAQGGVHGSALVAAIWNRSEGVIKILLRDSNEIIDTNEAMLADVAAWCADTEPLQLLLGKGIKVTKAAMISAAKNWHGPKALECLLAGGGQVTELVLSTAATFYERKEPLELLLDNGGQVTEVVLLAAVEGWNPNETLKILLARGGQVTEAMIVAIVGKSKVNTELLELMLSTNNTISITEAVMVNAARELGDRDVFKFLLSRGGQVTEAVLVAAAGNRGGPRTLKFFLSKDRTMPITEAMLIAAVSNSPAKKYVEPLMARGGEVTEEVMIAAAGGYSDTKELLEMFLKKSDQVTAPVLLAAACNWHSYEALEFLLSKGTKVIMTETMMLKALEGQGAWQAMELLLSVGGQITKAVMVEAARSQFSSKEILELLLSKGGQITEELMVEAARNRYHNFNTDVLQLLISRGGQVTKSVVMAAAWSSKEFLEYLLTIEGTAAMAEEMLLDAARNTNGLEVFEFLLALDYTITITEEMLVTAAKNTHARKYMAPLLRKGGEGMITENVLVAAAGNWHGKGALEFLLSVDDTVLITESVLVAAAGNSNGKELLESLLTDEHTVTEAMVLAAADNMDDSGVLEYLLSINDTIPITESMLVSALRHGHGSSFLQSLLKRGGQVTEKVMAAAAGSWTNGREYLETLLSSNSNPPITEAVLLAAAGDTTGKGTLEYLLSINDTTPITEAIVIAAAKNGEGEGFLKLLLDRGGQITEAVVVAAAGSWQGNSALEFLLQRQSIPTTEAMLLAAAERSQTGKKALELLLSADDTAVITEAILERAATASREVFAFLFHKAQTLLITEKMLVAAASNWKGREILEFMFSLTDSIAVSEGVIGAAAGNSGSNYPLEFLFNKAHNPPEITETILIKAAGNIVGNRALKFFCSFGEIIPPTKAMLVSAAWNPAGSQNLEFLLDRGGEVDEALMVGAALNPKDQANLEFLLNRRGMITECVMIAAAWNPSDMKTVTLEFLLNRGVEITERILFAAAMNPGGKQNLELLLSRGGRVTKAVSKARDKDLSKDEAIDFLLRSVGRISRTILLRAARDRAKGGPDLFEVYYESKGGHIAAKFLEAAGANESEELFAPPTRTGTTSIYVDAVSEITSDIEEQKSGLTGGMEEDSPDGSASCQHPIVFYLLKLIDLWIFCMAIYGLSPFLAKVGIFRSACDLCWKWLPNPGETSGMEPRTE